MDIKKFNPKFPLFTQVRQLEVGETIGLPIEKLASIRANTSTYGLMLQRKFTTHINRENETIEVTRKE